MCKHPEGLRGSGILNPHQPQSSCLSTSCALHLSGDAAAGSPSKASILPKACPTAASAALSSPRVSEIDGEMGGLEKDDLIFQGSTGLGSSLIPTTEVSPFENVLLPHVLGL